MKTLDAIVAIAQNNKLRFTNGETLGEVEEQEVCSNTLGWVEGQGVCWLKPDGEFFNWMSLNSDLARMEWEKVKTPVEKVLEIYWDEDNGMMIHKITDMKTFCEKQDEVDLKLEELLSFIRETVVD